MINYKKFINQSLIVILYLMPIIFFAGYDFAFVTYDSEPDYISAAFHINKYGIPFSSHHPGTITQYLISIPLIVGNYFHFPFNLTIILMRIITLSALAVLIVLTVNLMVSSKIKTKIFCYSTVWFLIFIYPSTSVLFKYISAEILLFGVSLLTCASWFKYLTDEKRFFLLGLMIAAGMNIKPTFIFLLIVLSFFHIFSYAYYSKIYKGILSLLKIFTCGIIFFTIFSIPKIFQIFPIMSNMGNDWITLISSISSKLLLWQFLFIGVIITATLYLFFWLKENGLLSSDNKNILNKLIKEGWIVVIPVFIFVFYKFYFYFIHPEIDYLVGLGQWESIGIMRRNSVPLYAFLVFFILKEIIKKIPKSNNFMPVFFSFILLFIGFITINSTSSKPFLFQKNSTRLFDKAIMDVKMIAPDAKIYIHHDNYFDSVIQFQLWTSIRYGNCNDKELKNMIKLSYPDLNFDNLSYMSPYIKVSKCPRNINDYVFQSFYDKWLNVSNNVIRLDICQELNSITNKKVYLIDSRFIDSVNSNQIIKDLRLVVENCGFKLYKNTKYLDNNEIFAYDIY